MMSTWLLLVPFHLWFCLIFLQWKPSRALRWWYHAVTRIVCWVFSILNVSVTSGLFLLIPFSSVWEYNHLPSMGHVLWKCWWWKKWSEADGCVTHCYIVTCILNSICQVTMFVWVRSFMKFHLTATRCIALLVYALTRHMTWKSNFRFIEHAAFSSSHLIAVVRDSSGFVCSSRPWWSTRW